MPNNHRIERVSSLLKKEITLIIMNNIEDPLVIENFISITKVDLSVDLQFCKVFISTSAESTIQNQILNNLNESKSMIKNYLSKRIQMRRIPDIIFKQDKVLEKGTSVLKLLDELRLNKKSKGSLNKGVEDEIK